MGKITDSRSAFSAFAWRAAFPGQFFNHPFCACLNRCSPGYIASMTPMQTKRLMKKLGFTQQQLADAIGAHRVTIADWVRGASKPTGLYLKALEALAAKAQKEEQEIHEDHACRRCRPADWSACRLGWT